MNNYAMIAVLAIIYKSEMSLYWPLQAPAPQVTTSILPQNAMHYTVNPTSNTICFIDTPSPPLYTSIPVNAMSEIGPPL